MTARTKKARPGMRLELGTSVLAAARAVDTRLVERRLRRFELAHQRYVDAQRKVAAARSAFDGARAQMRSLRAVQRDALERLACALDRRSKNPFGPFGLQSPWTIARLESGKGVAAIARLVPAVLLAERRQAVRAAATAALDAARAVERQLDAVGRRREGVRLACRRRDALGVAWDSALRSFRSGAIAAADDGAPQLHATLFPPVRRRTRAAATAEQA